MMAGQTNHKGRSPRGHQHQVVGSYRLDAQFSSPPQERGGRGMKTKTFADILQPTVVRIIAKGIVQLMDELKKGTQKD